MSMNQMFYKMLEGEWIENKYYLKKMLGAGGFGAVFCADEVLRDRVLREVAVKVIPPLPDAKKQEQQLNELIAAVNLNCPYLLRCFSAGEFDFAKNQFLYLVMELAEFSLEQRLEQGSLSVAQVQPMLKQIVSGLDYLHREKQEIHRDLKPGNVLWVSMRNSWVISDFGLVRKLGTESYTQTVNPIGTVAYMPPEAFDGKISTAWDIWSLGILIVATLNDGSIPYQFSGETQLFKQVINGKLKLPALPSELEEIVLGCLQQDWRKRWSTQQVLAVLKNQDSVTKAIASLKRQLESTDQEKRIVALQKAVNYGEEGFKLVTEAKVWDRKTLAQSYNTSIKLLQKLVQDQHEDVRVEVAGNKNTSIEVLRQLAQDPDQWVRRRVAQQQNTPIKLLKQLAQDPERRVRTGVTQNLNSPIELLKQLAQDVNEWVRRGVAQNPNASTELLQQLAQDKSKKVRVEVAGNANAPVEVLQQLKKQLNPGIIGIDFGTTNSRVSVIQGEKPIVISNAVGFTMTPSVIAYAKNGDLLVGQKAEDQRVMNPENTFYSVKQFIGREYHNIKKQAESVSYQVTRTNNNNNVTLYCPALDKLLTPEEILAKILRQLVEDANKYLGGNFTEAVITVPAYFNESQCQAIKDAGRIAGLDVKRLISESAAASLAYGFDKEENETILIFDLGGGTLDVSLLNIGDGVFEVLATSSDIHLGGDDFDQKIVNYLAYEFKKQEGIDIHQDKQALQRLTEVAEKTKIELSSISQVNINLPFITTNQKIPKHLNMTLTREKFEKLCSDLIHRCRIVVENTLQDLKMQENYQNWDESKIDKIVMIGGATRIPAVQQLVKKKLGKAPNLRVNSEEVVAIGAAIQGGVLSGQIKEILLLEITPFSFGVETTDGVISTVIQRNTTIPTKAVITLSTQVDGQTSIEFHILQAERELAKNNKSLGILRLDDIFPAPRGVPKIEVTFDIDANGILNVTAKDKRSGKEQSLCISRGVSGKGNLSEGELEELVANEENLI